MKYTSRDDYKAKKGVELFGESDCPFCRDLKPDDILWTGEYLQIIRNFIPYSGEKNHLMLIPLAHKKYFHELSSQEWAEMPKAQAFIKEFYGEDHYFSFTRETFGNRSVEHVHQQFLPGRVQGKFIRSMLYNQGFPAENELEI